MRKRGFPLYIRLLLYFLMVMAVPLLLMTVYYAINGQENVERNLLRQGEASLVSLRGKIADQIEAYRHKAYVLSTNRTVINALEGNPSQGLYETMFSIMTGDTYLANASIVSLDGDIRYSTHTFPSIYDLRYNRNDFSPFFDISRAGNQTASMMSLANRYRSTSNSQIVLNIIRRVLDEDGSILGYAVVDLFQEALASALSSIEFDDLVLMDSNSYLAVSLLHPETYGQMDQFPGLHISRVDSSYTESSKAYCLMSITGTPFVLAGIKSYAASISTVKDLLIIFMVLMIIGITIAIMLSLVFTKSIADPISDLIKSMQMLEKGLFKTRVKEARIKEIRDLDRSFNRMTAQIADLIETNKEEEAKLHTAERKALEAQINPHFLYNTLNTIKSLARINGQDEIYTIAVRLGKLLRANIDNDKALTSLGESFALVESYLIIQKIRFSSKLEYTIELEDSIAQIQTPKLILQPFVENAIGHGLEPKVGSWMLAVKGWKDGPRIHLSVEDNGVGFEDSLLKDMESLKDSGHVGVYNTYRRLRLHYGQSAYVSFSHRDEGGTRVDISFPIQEEKEMEKWPTQ